MSRETKSVLYALSAVLFWSTSATAFKLTLAGMESGQLVFYASVSSFLALAVLSLVRKVKAFGELLNPRNILLGLLNPFFYYLVLLKAYDILPAQEALPLNFTWPIVISIFSVIFLGEKFSSKNALGLISAFIGVIVIATKGDILTFKIQNFAGAAMAVGSAFVWGTFWILKLKDKRTGYAKLVGSFLWGTIFSGIYLALFDSFVIENPLYLFGGVYIGCFEMGITFFVWLKALELGEDKAKTSTIIYATPFFSMLIIALVLGEAIHISSVAGMILIVGGIIYQNVGIKNGENNKKQKPNSRNSTNEL